MYARDGIDFRRLIEPEFMHRVLCPDGVETDGVYQGRDGLQFRTNGSRSRIMQEVVRVAEDALLLACNWAPPGESWQKQSVGGSDWVHIQFYLEGSGQESFSEGNVINVPEESCVVVRYPERAIVERAIRAADSFRAACLFLQPKAVANLLGTTGREVLSGILKHAPDLSSKQTASVLPLTSEMRIAVNDIFGCTYRGFARRGYMRAKCLELLSAVVFGLDNQGAKANELNTALTPFDARRISQAEQIIRSELGTPMTLAQVARRVGINRTKLAIGFKQVYGTSLQAYWRDQKLGRAQELLRGGNARVTDVAFDLGYSHLSSFTRAFCQKYGYSPSSTR